jgi:hypothetical protein
MHSVHGRFDCVNSTIGRGIATLLLVACSGCGQAAYEAKMEKTLDRLKHEAQFNDLERFGIPRTEQLLQIPGTSYRIRLPKSFFQTATIFTPESQNPLTGVGLMPPELMQPPFIKLPSVVRLYQDIRQDDRGVYVPCFLYMAVLQPGQSDATDEPAEKKENPEATDGNAEQKPEGEQPASEEKKPADENAGGEEKKPADDKPADEKDKPADEKPADEKDKPADEKPADEKPADEKEKPVDEKEPAVAKKSLHDRIFDALNKAFPDAKSSWDDAVSCETPVQGARAIVWHRISAKGKQPFRLMTSDNIEQLPGTFDLWLYNENEIAPEEGVRIILAWRAPDSLQNLAPIEKWAPLVGGTLIGAPGTQ